MALAVPLGGMIYFWLRQRTLHARVINLANELDQRTTELEEAKQTLNRLAGLDSVTSLANHSAFQEFLRNEWRRALREASSISVLIVDIDRFTEYNDQLGHQLGDECLVKVGGAIAEHARRPGDLVARYGGGQFAIAMSRTDQQGAFRVAHRICAGIEGLALKHPESDVSPRVTVSVGVATSTPAVDSSWEELALVTEASAALGTAQKSGRNRVSTADGQQQAPDQS